MNFQYGGGNYFKYKQNAETKCKFMLMLKNNLKVLLYLINHEAISSKLFCANTCYICAQFQKTISNYLGILSELKTIKDSDLF